MRYVVIVACVAVGVFWAVQGLIWIERTDRVNQRNSEQRKLERANAACGDDKTLAIEAHVRGLGETFWYEVKCQSAAGDFYVEVIE